MITSINYRPHVYSGGYNPIVWSFTSNQNTQVDFSYVVDIYINAATGSTTPTYRLKQRPNQAGAGMIDVSSIVQPFIQLTDYSVEEGWNNYYRSSADITPSVFIKVGEEYIGGTGSTLTTFNGFGATGNPAYYIASLEQVAYPVSVLPAALPWESAVDSMADTNTYGYFSPYMLGGATGAFLKRDSNTITLRSVDHHTLSFINWNYKFTPGLYGRPVQGIAYTAYGATGGVIASSFYQNTVTNGGGPQTASNYTTATWSKDTAMLTFRCGPKDLGITNPLITYYTIQAYYKPTATSSTTPQSVASELVTFNIDDSCQTLYPVVRLSWLNDLGARDYYNFNMFYELTSASTEDTYSQNPLNWNSTEPVVTNKTSNTSPNWMRGGSKSFNKVVNRTFTIQSDWLTQEYVDYLGAVSESPSVWAYIGTAATPYTVIVDKAEYTYKNIKQVKMVQATFVCKMTKTQPKQNY
jgi:hypothetical protein